MSIKIKSVHLFLDDRKYTARYFYEIFDFFKSFNLKNLDYFEIACSKYSEIAQKDHKQITKAFFPKQTFTTQTYLYEDYLDFYKTKIYEFFKDNIAGLDPLSKSFLSYINEMFPSHDEPIFFMDTKDSVYAIAF